jgi:hypothetical protein
LYSSFEAHFLGLHFDGLMMTMACMSRRQYLVSERNNVW